MEEKDLIRLLKNYMPADQSPMPAPDPLLVIEARLTVEARREKQLRYRAARVIALARAGVRPLAAAAMLLLTLGVVLPRNHSGSNTASAIISEQANITASMRNTTLSVISSTMLTSIPTLRN